MMFDILICEKWRANNWTNDKTSDQSKLKAFTDDELKVIQMAKFILDKAENIAVKEKMLVTSNSSFTTMLWKGAFFRFVKSQDCVVKG